MELSDDDLEVIGVEKSPSPKFKRLRTSISDQPKKEDIEASLFGSTGIAWKYVGNMVVNQDLEDLLDEENEEKLRIRLKEQNK